MPTNRTLTRERARYASLGYHRPGSPEYEQAAREYFCCLLTEQITDALSKSPPLTSEQREALIAVLAGS